MNLTNLFASSIWKKICPGMLVAAAFLLSPQHGQSMGLLTPVNLPYAVAMLPEEKLSEKPAPISGRDLTKGEWTSRQTRDKYCIRFGETNERHIWGTTQCFDKTAFEKQQADLFVLTRETGTLTLKGMLLGDKGEGTYEFVADAGFNKFLSGNNISSRDENFLFHLFLADIKREYIRFLKSQYSHISGERLLELAIYGMTQKHYQIYITLFEQYSSKKPAMQEVVEAKIHRLDGTYIKELRASGFTDLSMKKMMEVKILGVDAGFIYKLKKEGFTGLTINQVLSAKIYGVNPAYLVEYHTYRTGGLK